MNFSGRKGASHLTSFQSGDWRKRWETNNPPPGNLLLQPQCNAGERQPRATLHIVAAMPPCRRKCCRKRCREARGSETFEVRSLLPSVLTLDTFVQITWQSLCPLAKLRSRRLLANSSTTSSDPRAAGAHKANAQLGEPHIAHDIRKAPSRAHSLAL